MADRGPWVEFDRGTVRVGELPAGLEPDRLPGLRWDPRVRAWRAPGYTWPALEAALRAAGQQVPRLLRCDGPPTGAWRPLDLRPYQAAALDAWELAGRRGLVVLPTGTGKTRVALAAAARAEVATLVLVTTRALVGFWTPRYLEHKLAQLRAARLPSLVLCVDERRGCGGEELPPDARIVTYRGNRVPADRVLAAVEAASRERGL